MFMSTCKTKEKQWKVGETPSLHLRHMRGMALSGWGYQIGEKLKRRDQWREEGK